MSGDDLAAPVLQRRRRLSPVWAVPIVALLAAGWLAYVTFAEKGPTITISFRTGQGLEAGKTRIKHNDVELGMISKIDLAPDFSHVVVTAVMNRAAATHLNAGTRFWVVRPRIGLGSLSGLETLVSGVYVEMDPGTGEANDAFVGLEDPPVVRADVPGREFILTTDKLGSIGPGTPIYFHSVKVGEALGYEIAASAKNIAIHAFVRAPYDSFVHDGSRFWNDSGIAVTAGPQGFKLEIESLEAVLAGGIGFDTPEAASATPSSQPGTVFPLFADRDSVSDATYVQRVPFVVEFEGSVHGLEVGAPVEFRGIKVGNVTAIGLVFDPEHDNVRIPVSIDFEPQRVQRVGIGPGAPSAGERVLQVMNEMVARGMRAQLRTSSLITGQLVVAFDFFPKLPAAKIDFTGPVPRLPSVPSDMESLTVSVNDLLSRMSTLMDQFGKLPLDEVLNDARDVLQSFKAVTDTPEFKGSIRTLDKTLGDADESLRQLDALLASANSGYGGDSQVRREMVDLLRQLQDTAKSVRVLADYLDAHPEALIRGKGAP